MTRKRDSQGHGPCPLTASLPEPEGRGGLDLKMVLNPGMPSQGDPGPLNRAGLVSPPAEQGGSRPARVRERSACVVGPPRPPAGAPRPRGRGGPPPLAQAWLRLSPSRPTGS